MIGFLLRTICYAIFVVPSLSITGTAYGLFGTEGAIAAFAVLVVVVIILQLLGVTKWVENKITATQLYKRFAKVRDGAVRIALRRS